MEDVSDEAVNTILFGSDEVFKIKQYTDSSATSYSIAFEESQISSSNKTMNKVLLPSKNGYKGL